MLGFYPNKETVVPIDFPAFMEDISRRRDHLHMLQSDVNYLLNKHDEVT